MNKTRFTRSVHLVCAEEQAWRIHWFAYAVRMQFGAERGVGEHWFCEHCGAVRQYGFLRSGAVVTDD